MLHLRDYHREAGGWLSYLKAEKTGSGVRDLPKKLQYNGDSEINDQGPWILTRPFLSPNTAPPRQSLYPEILK